MEKKPKVFMVCGISGSGKTAFSKKLELSGVPRISMDEELWPDFYVLGNLISDEHKDFLYKQASERIFAKIRNFCAEGRARPLSLSLKFSRSISTATFRSRRNSASCRSPRSGSSKTEISSNPSTASRSPRKLSPRSRTLNQGIGDMKFEPNVHTLVWGSESWEISAHDSSPSVIADGVEKGRTLADVEPEFPVLAKVIDAKTRLSVQVHPNERSA